MSYYVDDDLELLIWNKYNFAIDEKASDTIEEAVEQKRKELNIQLDKLLEKEYLYYVNDDFMFVQINKEDANSFNKTLLAETPEEAIELKLNQIKLRLNNLLEALKKEQNI